MKSIVRVAVGVASMTLFVAPVDAAKEKAKASSPARCLVISETETNASSERFHSVLNRCERGVIIYYCFVRPGPLAAEWTVGECRGGKESQRAAFDHRLQGFLYNMGAMEKSQSSVKASKLYLDDFRKNGYPAKNLSGADMKPIVDAIGDAPASMYTIRPNERFVSPTTSSSNYAPRNFIIPSACYVDDYLADKCMPDAPELWKALGKPLDLHVATAALREYGFTVN